MARCFSAWAEHCPPTFSKDLQPRRFNGGINCPLLEAKAKVHPTDGGLAARLASLYAMIERKSPAVAMLARAERYASVADANNARMDVAYLLAKSGKAKESLPLFRKIAETGTTPTMRHLGRFNTAISLIQLGRGAEAVPYLKLVTGAKDVPEEFRQRAQAVLDQIQASRG